MVGTSVGTVQGVRTLLVNATSVVVAQELNQYDQVTEKDQNETVLFNDEIKEVQVGIVG